MGFTMMDEDYITNTSLFSTTAVPDGVDSGSTVQQKQLVYLTSDAEETLETLDPSCAYIIGGIVDRNRLKGATYKKAVSQQVRTAKLPIKENFQMKATHVLTVNHVFEILLNYSQCHSWPEAIVRVLPQRKVTPKVKGKEGEEGKEEGKEEEVEVEGDGGEGEGEEDGDDGDDVEGKEHGSTTIEVTEGESTNTSGATKGSTS